MLSYAKGFAGGLVAGLTAISIALDDGTLTAQDWVKGAIAFILGLGIVAAVPNKK